jgi:hypothetical protein
MRGPEIAGQLYQFSLSTRSEITQSLQLPLLVISVFAAAASTLLPQYGRVEFSDTTFLDALYYSSSILLIIFSCASLIITLSAFSGRKYVRVIAGEQFSDLVGNENASNADLDEAEKILATKLIEAAHENDEINAERAKSRRSATILLVLAAALFVCNISLFLAGSRLVS